MICPGCQNENRADASFCDACGQRLVRAVEPEAERRPLTVLFCDLVDSTRLSASMDPEEFRDVLRQLQAEAEGLIHQFGGRVAQLLGDGLMVYFGHPTAHEDDPTRALRAAAAILDALPEVNERLAPLLGERKLNVRIGIHTGRVVVGEMGGGSHRERLALGDTPNVAARIQGLASPGTAVLSEATRRVSASAIETRDLGEHEVRGIEHKMRLHELAAVPDRTAAPLRVHRFPLVARREELEQLEEVWRVSTSGHGQLAVLSGDAGIGKTRLVGAFRERVQRQGGRDWLEWRGSPLHTATAFHPVAVAIRSLLGITSSDSPDRIFEALEREFGSVPGANDQTLPLIADLCTLPLPAHQVLSSVGPAVQRARVIETLQAWIAHRCQQGSLTFVVEDLHWIDPSTKELLRGLEEQLPKHACLMIYTFRDGYQLTPPSTANLHIDLAPLETKAARTLVRSVAGAQVLSDTVVERVMERADGIPLFLEEITQAVLESASDMLASADLDVPATLESSLMARLDRLGRSKAVAQRAAVLGREVPLALLLSLLGPNSADLEPAIDALSDAGLARTRADASGDVLIFKHALVRKLAEESLLRAQRREIHSQAVDTIETDFPELVVREPERLARHCRGANRLQECIAYLRQAGEQAMERSAHAEAMSHIDEGLSLIEELPKSEERVLLEIELNLALGAAMVAAKGYGHPDVERTHVRARELSMEIVEESPLYTISANLFLFHASRADLDTAEAEAIRLVRIGERDSEVYCVRFGESFRGVIDYYRGHFHDAQSHFERAIELISDAPAPDWYCHEHRPNVVAHAYGSLGLAAVGEIDRAMQHSDASLTAAQGSPLNEGYAIGYAVLLSYFLGDARRALELSERGVAICTKHDFPMYLAIATLARGWSKAKLGDLAAGLPDVNAGLAIGASTGTVVEGPRAFAIAAEAQLLADDPERAEALAQSGLGLAAHRGNHFWDAELLRLQAVSEVQQGRSDEARGTLASAQAVAERQASSALAARIQAAGERYRIESSSGAP